MKMMEHRIRELCDAKLPWSALAYQLAGDAGLKVLHPDGKAEERDSAPATNILTELFALPTKEGLATLILIDEVLMYAHGKVSGDETWRGRGRLLGRMVPEN